jgi:hypothetical protein
MVRPQVFLQRAGLGCVFCQQQGATLLQVAGKGLFPDGLDEELVSSLRVPAVRFNRRGSFPPEECVPAVVLL